MRVEGLEDRALMSHVVHAMQHRLPPIRAAYGQINLVTDNPSVNPAANTDPQLTNPWGIAFTASSPFWVANNHSGLATVYNSTGAKQAITVTIPSAAGSPAGTVGSPTGIVANTTNDFAIPGPGGGPSHFIFATEDGTIAAWSAGNKAVTVVDRSATGAVYKGLAMASNQGANDLYATNFNAGTIDVFDRNFNPVVLSPGAFTDPRLHPGGFTPFGIANVQGNLIVTYAKPDSARHDDTPGRGLGIVDAFDPAGNLLLRVATRGNLNAPWGVAVAPASFGRAGGDLLIGNFGDGRINAYKLVGFQHPHFIPAGQLPGPNGRPITIDGLWGLAFGNGTRAGDPNTLYFTAGPNDENDGLFGGIAPLLF